MTQDNTQKIIELISASDYAYSIFTEMGQANTDYADFVSLSFHDFKSLLGKPDMTQRQLRHIVRKARTNHRNSAPESCWATFLAGYLDNAANQRISHL